MYFTPTILIGYDGGKKDRCSICSFNGKGFLALILFKNNSFDYELLLNRSRI